MKRKNIAPYKSTLEYKLAKLIPQCEYEPKGSKVPYSIHHEYVPDFIHPNQPDVLLEAKGYFINGYKDCQKYLAVQECNPNKELIFIFSDPFKRAYPQCRVRKDGSVLSLAEWCVGNNFLYFKVEKIPTEIINGMWNVDAVRDYKRRLYN